MGMYRPMTRVGLCRASLGKGNSSFLRTVHPGFHDRFSQRHRIEAEHLLLGIVRAMEPELTATSEAQRS